MEMCCVQVYRACGCPERSRAAVPLVVLPGQQALIQQVQARDWCCL